ncbi:uncharacterized protein LOC112560374 isoform X2 [Pomacea canaliculata]|uniref:uncharacterized protein LOC112560374 isoform X2 n=1 Tax=Pomacea canaliculata TaxID=400727 RepID=UPI000D73A578|nr:uncharacterized protein LOC112560374 isoform X2 [Pomacea canaliculata]
MFYPDSDVGLFAEATAHHHLICDNFSLLQVEDEMQQLMSCSCFFCNTTRRNYVNCRICSEADTDDTSWDKATFSIVTVAVIVGAGFVLSVIFRNKIITAWRRNDKSSRCANNSCTDKIEVIPERLHHTLANDTETSSSTSRLSSARTEVREDYRPLQKSVIRNNPFTTTQCLQIQPYIHRVFEEEGECEVYTEIIDDDMECDPRPQARLECDVMSPFLKMEGGQEVNDDDYNRLDHQSNRNKPTDCVSADEENCRLLCCPDRLTEAQLCDEYEVAKPVTDAHVNSNKFANDNSLPDNTFDAHTEHEITPSTPRSTSLDYSSDEHTLHDSPLENKIPQHQTSNEHPFSDHVSNNNLLHDNTPTERIPRDNPSPYDTLTTLSPQETV